MFCDTKQLPQIHGRAMASLISSERLLQVVQVVGDIPNNRDALGDDDDDGQGL